MINIDLSDYDYDLPVKRIAQFPATERDGSRLLLYKNKNISEDIFRNIDKYIPSGSLLLFNDTKVIRARLIFVKESGAKIEVLCLEPLSPSEYTLSFSAKYQVEWKCLVGNLKKWKKGTINTKFTRNNKQINLQAERVNPEGDAWRIRFSWDSGDLTFGDVIESTGHVPLPPYIDRSDAADDSVRYQTIYSQKKGSVASPTAGLHFTREVFNRLSAKEIQISYLTLHVGAGTFQPVKSDRILEHVMHSEHLYISKSTIESILKNIGSVITVGTTSVRTIESLFWAGTKLFDNPLTRPDELYINQWEVYSIETKLSPSQSLESVLSWMERHNLNHIHMPTRIIIVPGYDFKLTSGIITNFHQPKSTLLLLISAWVGNDWKRIYNYALDHDFRFLSYGDSSLLMR